MVGHVMSAPVITLEDRIGALLADGIISLLMHYERQRVPRLFLALNSPGGDLIATYQIIATIEAMNAAVEGVVLSKAGSGCFNILQHCTWRSAMPNASLMFHAPTIHDEAVLTSSDVQMQTASNWYVRELKNLSARTGHSIQQWRHWAREERYFTGMQAFELGIVDSVVFQPPF